ncbi:unnamed protein product [Ambrosiozyma monospora]|uniref:Unnamed protein product n=1 Tax=Ambrosiozyma monospora TaxID=43982 RepID=A0ACB5THF1_AMBMO|nr:unnamed protein product [Ambrosiozyma monospora]
MPSIVCLLVSTSGFNYFSSSSNSTLISASVVTPNLVLDKDGVTLDIEEMNALYKKDLMKFLFESSRSDLIKFHSHFLQSYRGFRYLNPKKCDQDDQKELEYILQWYCQRSCYIIEHMAKLPGLQAGYPPPCKLNRVPFGFKPRDGFFIRKEGENTYEKYKTVEFKNPVSDDNISKFLNNEMDLSVEKSLSLQTKDTGGEFTTDNCFDTLRQLV